MSNNNINSLTSDKPFEGLYSREEERVKLIKGARRHYGPVYTGKFRTAEELARKPENVNRAFAESLRYYPKCEEFHRDWQFSINASRSHTTLQDSKRAKELPTKKGNLHRNWDGKVHLLEKPEKPKTSTKLSGAARRYLVEKYLLPKKEKKHSSESRDPSSIDASSPSVNRKDLDALAKRLAETRKEPSPSPRSNKLDKLAKELASARRSIENTLKSLQKGSANKTDTVLRVNINLISIQADLTGQAKSAASSPRKSCSVPDSFRRLLPTLSPIASPRSASEISFFKDEASIASARGLDSDTGESFTYTTPNSTPRSDVTNSIEGKISPYLSLIEDAYAVILHNRNIQNPYAIFKSFNEDSSLFELEKASYTSTIEKLSLQLESAKEEITLLRNCVEREFGEDMNQKIMCGMLNSISHHLDILTRKFEGKERNQEKLKVNNSKDIQTIQNWTTEFSRLYSLMDDLFVRYKALKDFTVIPSYEEIQLPKQKEPTQAAACRNIDNINNQLQSNNSVCYDFADNLIQDIEKTCEEHRIYPEKKLQELTTLENGVREIKAIFEGLNTYIIEMQDLFSDMYSFQKQLVDLQEALETRGVEINGKSFDPAPKKALPFIQDF